MADAAPARGRGGFGRGGREGGRGGPRGRGTYSSLNIHKLLNGLL